MERPKLGIEISPMLQRPSLEFMARNCLRPAVARAARTGPGRAARLTLQVSENPIDDSGIGDDGDNLHLCAAETEKRIHLENTVQKLSPRIIPWAGWSTFAGQNIPLRGGAQLSPPILRDSRDARRDAS